MGGRANGISKHEFINARVATGGKTERPIELLYTPAHTKPDGKNVRARLQIPILVNVRGKTEPDSFRLTAWGGLADMFAKNLSQGKEMTFFCDASSYWANTYNNANVQVMQPDGGPLQTRSVGFVIREFLFGGDSERTKIEETNVGMKTGEGRKPAQWNMPGTPDNLTWLALLERRKQNFYAGGDRFGYAKVIGPKTPGCTILLGDQSKLKTNTGTADAATAAGVAPAANVPPAPGSPLVNEVTNVLGATGTQLPAAQGQHVNV